MATGTDEDGPHQRYVKNRRWNIRDLGRLEARAAGGSQVGSYNL